MLWIQNSLCGIFGCRYIKYTILFFDKIEICIFLNIPKTFLLISQKPSIPLKPSCIISKQDDNLYHLMKTPNYEHSLRTITKKNQLSSPDFEKQLLFWWKSSNILKFIRVKLPIALNCIKCIEKIPQSGICPALCVLRHYTVVFAWKCCLFCLCAHGQCRICYIYHVEFHFRFRRLVSFPV